MTITLRDAALSDRYDLAQSPVLLSGTQALVRACLMQAAADRAAGLDTAGYVTGYRGSPLGAVDGVFQAAQAPLAAAGVRFHPGLNEDLAATALWGTQQAELRGEGRHQGVFGLWYGKGPGVDRSGDVLRHANLAGSSPHGGVLVVMGDDHTCESSTTCHQSEPALIDAMIPILSPAGVQEILDYALHGWALSRHAGVWVGLKAMKDTVEATAVVVNPPAPQAVLAHPNLNIRLGDTPQAQEARLHDAKMDAVREYARAHRLDRRLWGVPGARIGIVAAGKSALDVTHALGMLGIDADRAVALGITTYKPAMVWPLEPQGLIDWARGLDLIVVVEEKRGVIEMGITEILFNLPGRPRVVGKRDLGGEWLFPAKLDLNPALIARGLARVLGAEGLALPDIAGALDALEASAPALAERAPWFCAGCPHNSSTKLPDGARAYAGIGCHYMVQWMDRATEGYTHMGGEGANWIGEAPFSTRDHVFQNMGDGTYNHSGLMAIRAAVGAGVNVTFKILYNDAVAMTGGQHHDGGMTPGQIAAEVLAAGAARVAAVVDGKEAAPTLPAGVASHPREELMAVQTALAAIPGVTVLIYVQTCAAEKRRRRRRGTAPDPVERVFINPEVCEGCGDCGVQSNCVAILPLETPLGRKRQIDQSACNKDFSCLSGFCPSFVTVAGAQPRRGGRALAVPVLPEPVLPVLDRVWGLLVTGVGGTGVVTVGALITMAAHLEGKGASEMQMAGLAQKGGSVAIHCRIARAPGEITAIRLQPGEADGVIGGDLVVTAAPKSLAMMAPGRARVVCNTDLTPTGAFTRDIGFTLPGAALLRALEARVGAGLTRIDATRLAERLLGDAIYANVLLLGAAWQAGLVPLGLAALHRAIELNGAGVQGNLAAFDLGRWAVVDPGAVAALLDPVAVPDDLAAMIERRAAHLTAYQNEGLAARYRALVTRAEAAGLGEAVAEGYFKLLSYKDEYEVARLHTKGLAPALAAAFEGGGRVSYHLAPPILGGRDAAGRPRKRRFGPWMGGVLRLLARGKVLRGTPLDPFGYSAERRAERAAITDYEALMAEVLPRVTPANREIAEALARLPVGIRGFGPVKAANAARVAEEQAALLAQFRQGGAPMAQAAE